MQFPQLSDILKQAAAQGGPSAPPQPPPAQGAVDPGVARYMALQMAKSQPPPSAAPGGMPVAPGTAPFPLSPQQAQRYQSLGGR